MHDNQLSSMLDKLSCLLAKIYAASDNSSIDDFQRDALALVKEVIPFDRAVWGSGMVTDQRQPVIFSVYLFHYPLSESEWLAWYEPMIETDPALARALANPGTTINLATADVAEQLYRVPGQKAFIESLELRHTLMTVTNGPISELLGAVTLFRRDAAQPFTEAERLLVQNVTPHLVSLCNRNRMRQLEAALQPARERWQPAAGLADSTGTIYNANAEFVRLVHREWPQWHGPKLPAPVVSAMQKVPAKRVLFANIALHIHTVNDLYLLYLREIASADGLSQREWDVAEAFGEGLSHKEIARHLGIAPGTVRNHLSSIYNKLQVSNKVELIEALKMAPR